MTIENPFIQQECEQQGISPNDLKTFLQPQYGQLGEDLILDAIMSSLCIRFGLTPSHIRYLDVGANHPIQTSNTYLFYQKYGASGILIEANPALIDLLRRSRPRDEVINCAVVPDEKTNSVGLLVAEHSELTSLDQHHIESFGEIGKVQNRVTVKACTLDSVLQNRFERPPHLLSLDIEGLDLHVLQASKFPRRPWLVTCEPSRHYQENSDLLFSAVMEEKGYQEIARTAYNIIYIDARLLSIPSYQIILNRLRAANRLRRAIRRNKMPKPAI